MVDNRADTRLDMRTPLARVKGSAPPGTASSIGGCTA